GGAAARVPGGRRPGGPTGGVAAPGPLPRVPFGRIVLRPSKYTGTPGTPLPSARSAGPARNRPIFPVEDRVPSGKMAIEQPRSSSHSAYSSAPRPPPRLRGNDPYTRDIHQP